MKITELQHAIEARTALYRPLYDFLLDSYMLVPHSAQLAQKIQSVATAAAFFMKFGVYALAWNFLRQRL